MEDEIIKINYWHKPIKNITFGFMFTTMTFSFLGLNYILPTLATVLLYIGFRDFRKVNKELNVAWIFSIINMVLYVLNLIYISTPLNVSFKNNTVLAFISIVFQVSFLIVFRMGIKRAFYESDIIAKKDPVLGIIIWKIVVGICAITELGQIWIIYIPVIISYVYIFRSLYKLSYELEPIYYISSRENIKLNKKKLLWIYSIACIVVVGICCLLSNHIKLNSSEVVQVNEFGNRNKLIDSGIPLEIVQDIEDEDINMLNNIINVESFNEELNFDSKINDSNLKVTSIFIELKNKEMYAVEYFAWNEGAPYWQDGIEISNTYPLKLINGRLLYDNDGINYTAPIPRLKDGTFMGEDILGEKKPRF